MDQPMAQAVRNVGEGFREYSCADCKHIVGDLGIIVF